jgi:hypothetical protein
VSGEQSLTGRVGFMRARIEFYEATAHHAVRGLRFGGWPEENQRVYKATAHQANGGGSSRAGGRQESPTRRKRTKQVPSRWWT